MVYFPCLKDYGIIPLYDITGEAAYTKLCWLLGRSDLLQWQGMSVSFSAKTFTQQKQQQQHKQQQQQEKEEKEEAGVYKDECMGDLNLYSLYLNAVKDLMKRNLKGEMPEVPLSPRDAWVDYDYSFYVK